MFHKVTLPVQGHFSLTNFMPLVSTPLWYSDVLIGYRKRPVAWNGLMGDVATFE